MLWRMTCGTRSAEPGSLSMMSRLGSHPSRAWLGAFALVSLAYVAGGCGRDRRKPRPTPPQRPTRRPTPTRRHCPRPRTRPRCRRPCGPDVHAVHRRPRPDGGAPFDPRGGHLQPHLLLRGQRRAAGMPTRWGRPSRSTSTRSSRRRTRPRSRRLRAAAPRHAGGGVDGRQGRPRGGPGHHPAGAAGDRGLHQTHPHEHQRGGRDRPGLAGDRLGRRSVRQGRLRPQGQRPLGEPAHPERDA